jgi:hypothetical protein
MRAEMLEAAREVTKTKSNPPIEDAFDAATVSVPRNSWLSALAVACQYLADHSPTALPLACPNCGGTE